MKVARFFPLFVATLLLSAFSVFADGWGDNYKEALATAAKENKKVLLDFTGTGWCPLCVELQKDVFNQPKFKEYADKNLVLMEVEITPIGKTLTAEVTRQNNDLLEQYQVEAFPTLILLNPEGKVIDGKVGYPPKNPKEFINWVNSAK